MRSKPVRSSRSSRQRRSASSFSGVAICRRTSICDIQCQSRRVATQPDRPAPAGFYFIEAPGARTHFRPRHKDTPELKFSTAVDNSNCPTQLDASRRAVLREALLAAYSEAAEVCDPERGYNDLLHGLIVYHLTGFRLQRGFEDDPGVNYEFSGAGPELSIDGLRLRWNKVGRSASEQIAASFPRPSLAGALMAEANQQLGLWADEFDATEPVNWILAHIGNPRDGLIRAYLAAPLRSDGRAITGWASWVAIYDAAQPQIDLPEAPAPGLPEPVEIEPVEISLIEETQLGAGRE